jgi:probable rRNA maturation factor
MPKTYISVTLTGDSEIQELNKKHLNRNNPTDVLSFNINEKLEDGTLYLGDVVVSTERAEKQAKEYGNTKEEEISDLVAHGVLHLLGVDHPEKEHQP